MLDAAGVERAHVVGLSMGGFCTLHLGLRHPERALSLVVAGVGYGSQPERQEAFRAESAVIARAFRDEGAARSRSATRSGRRACSSRTRTRADGRSSREALAGHDATGAALTMLGVQAGGPRSTT